MGAVKKVIGLGERLHPHSLLMGRKQSAQYNLAGQLVGEYDDLYKPAKVEDIPSPAANDSSAFVARDRMRRLARKASGRDSTIRTSAAGAPYSGAPKSLLGS